MYDLNTDYFIYINYWDFGGSIFVSSRVAKKQTKSAERYSFVSWLTANWLFLCFSLLKCCSWFCMVFLVTQYVHFKIRHYWGNREKQQQEPLAKGRDFRHAFLYSEITNGHTCRSIDIFVWCFIGLYLNILRTAHCSIFLWH